jgi:hypothetical protein
MIPIISLYGPAIRTQGWLQIYNILQDNEIPFEIVFVGPNEPDYILPDNFKYIKADVKPSQCMEIAARNSTGELLLNVVDDLEFVTTNALDKLYNTYISYNESNLIVSCRYMMDGIDISNECHRFHATDPTSPIMPVSGLISKKLYSELGGIDRNFLALFSDLDIALRLYSIGGKVVLSDVYVNEVVNSVPYGTKSSLLDSEVGVHDRLILNRLWAIGNDNIFRRIRMFEPFSDENILIESQGPKGRW